MTPTPASGVAYLNATLSEYEHSDMYKAVAWAVQSARATVDPVLTLCILPAWDESSDTAAYGRWLRQARHNCHVLMRVPKTCFKFMTPDAWKGVAPTICWAPQVGHQLPPSRQHSQGSAS
jgi:hypothetical protein